MKKIIIFLIFMIFEINGMRSHAEYVNESLSSLHQPIKIKKLSAKELTEKHDSMTSTIIHINDSIYIDKIYVFQYKNILAKHESGNLENPYQVVNQYGYAGKYQFGKSTLRTLHKFELLSYNVDQDINNVFLKDSIIQENALNALIVYNLNYAKKKNLFRFVGKKIHGVKITVEGILAGSHLVGGAAVAQFLDSGGSFEDFYINDRKIKMCDANGVTVLDYIKIFENI